MERKPINPLMMAATIVWTLVTFAAFAHGEVSFYVQRSGTPEDTAHAEFLDMLGEYDESDFEDETLAPLHGEVSELWYGDLGITIQGDWGGPYVPTIVSSSEFDVEGEVFQRALLAGFGLTVRPVEGTRINAYGLWLFDDGKTVDAAYIMRAVEEDGTEWEMTLENETPLNPHRHEIEGFIGVYSDIGLASVTITPIDPITGEEIVDVFETDHWIVAVDVMPPPADDTPSDAPSDEPPWQWGWRTKKAVGPPSWSRRPGEMGRYGDSKRHAGKAIRGRQDKGEDERCSKQRSERAGKRCDDGRRPNASTWNRGKHWGGSEHYSDGDAGSEED